MDRRLPLSIAHAVTAAAALACAPQPAPPPLGAVEHCQRAAELLYDVTWAAACLKTPDDSTDCTLPDPEAAKVNALLASEEARCMAVETHANAAH